TSPDPMRGAKTSIATASLVTNFAAGWAIPFILSLPLTHILALFCIAIPSCAGAVIYTRASVYPHLHVGLPTPLNRRRWDCDKRICYGWSTDQSESQQHRYNQFSHISKSLPGASVAPLFLLYLIFLLIDFLGQKTT